MPLAYNQTPKHGRRLIDEVDESNLLTNHNPPEPPNGSHIVAMLDQSLIKPIAIPDKPFADRTGFVKRTQYGAIAPTVQKPNHVVSNPLGPPKEKDRVEEQDVGDTISD